MNIKEKVKLSGLLSSAMKHWISRKCEKWRNEKDQVDS